MGSTEYCGRLEGGTERRIKGCRFRAQGRNETLSIRLVSKNHQAGKRSKKQGLACHTCTHTHLHSSAGFDKVP